MGGESMARSSLQSCVAGRKEREREGERMAQGLKLSQKQRERDGVDEERGGERRG